MARVLKVKYPLVKIVFITMHADPAYVRAAFEAGASAYLLKRCVGEELGQAMRAVRSGNFYVTPLVTEGSGRKHVARNRWRDALGARTHDPSARSASASGGRAYGEGNRRLAQNFPRTVEFHKGQIMEQLNLHTTVELVNMPWRKD